MVKIMKDKNDIGINNSRLVGRKLNIFVQNWGILFVLLALGIILSIFSDVFLARQNLINIFRQVSVTGIIACGMTLVIISGSVDLAVGSIVSLVSVVAVSLMISTGNLFVGLSAAIAIGFLSGALNGFLISLIRGKLGLAFIITYGMLTLYGAIALLVTKGATINWEYLGFTNPIYSFIGKGSIGFVPFPVVLFILIAVFSQFLLKFTNFGRVIQNMGFNIEATRLSGINVRNYRILIHGYLGILSAIAAIILTSRVTSATPLGGVGYEFEAITAVVIGGTSLSGGKGNVIKTIIGVLILGVIFNSMMMLHINKFLQQTAQGSLIIIAVIIDMALSKRRKLIGG